MNPIWELSLVGIWEHVQLCADPAFPQGRLLNLSCSTVPTFVLSITATTQVCNGWGPAQA